LADAERVALVRRVEKASARVSIEAIAAPTLSQCPANVITTAHTASTMFAMDAMLGWHAAQLKMPRPDAYA
jgi:hypothetical protein